MTFVHCFIPGPSVDDGVSSLAVDVSMVDVEFHFGFVVKSVVVLRVFFGC